jgi:hypothetical protein
VQLVDTLLDEGKFEDAKHVYQNGAFSRNYAKLTFGFQGLPANMNFKTPLTGENDVGQSIKGWLMNTAKLGDKEVLVLYANDDNEVQCVVGGNPAPDYDGCKLLPYKSHEAEPIVAIA